MSIYDPLKDHLAQQRTDEVPMTFDDIERVIGAALPKSAGKFRAWWSNNPTNNVMTQAWIGAGFRTERVDMPGRKLVFRRARAETPAPPREGRHPAWGALRGTVKVAPGVDLTDPLLEPWGGERW
jgi:YD repeat-containing protein